MDKMTDSEKRAIRIDAINRTLRYYRKTGISLSQIIAIVRRCEIVRFGHSMNIYKKG